MRLRIKVVLTKLFLEYLCCLKWTGVVSCINIVKTESLLPRYYLMRKVAQETSTSIFWVFRLTLFQILVGKFSLRCIMFIGGKSEVIVILSSGCRLRLSSQREYCSIERGSAYSTAVYVFSRS